MSLAGNEQRRTGFTQMPTIQTRLPPMAGPEDISTDDALARLLALNLERATGRPVAKV